MHTLIIDDEEFVRLIVAQALGEEGCEVRSVDGGQQGLDLLRSASFDCVITDLRMPGIDGRAVLRWVKEHQPDVDVIVLTGQGDVKDAVAAIKEGAWDFLIKDTPFDGAAVKSTLARLRTVRGLRRENRAARLGGYRQNAIVEGVSQAWRTLKSQIAQVAPSQAPVLIQGETGSGKEVVARLLHMQSRRADGPCIAVNCGALSRELLESELFGYEKGAFTGATTAKAGLISAADGGSLFLDEVGEMPGPMQVSLLRFLDRGEYRPVGSTRALRADVRLICATNRDLQELILQGRFRDDLLYRINTVTLLVPPLRERQEDLPALAGHIVNSLRMPGATTRTLTPETLRHLATYRWPGNVRELRNIIERIVLMSSNGGPITRDEVLQILPRSPSAASSEDQWQLPLCEVERRHIELVLKASGGNKTKAAQVLRIDYKTLLSKLKTYEPGS
ncbi:MAG: Sigma-54 dependent response regulator [Nitrospira sp.]|jgi:DNA-binding NtrC family response regulator|nr:Sigma-54 dependent response regulator [Nitrospira sp.]